jgi:predicted lipid-binding transport protein (Tim44 family)
MSDKTKPVTAGRDISDKTKPADPIAWADQNRTIAGALLGGAAGIILPGLGTLIGAIIGAAIGFASAKER